MPDAPATHSTGRMRAAPRQPDNRPSAARRGYDRRWQKVRALKLRMDPLCEGCKRAGRVTPANEVHHVVALADGGERLAMDNLESLCKPCHSRETGRERQGRGV